jgi:hypothetical protein
VTTVLVQARIIGVRLFALALLAAAAIPPGFAEEGGPKATDDGKGTVISAESGDHGSRSRGTEDAGGGTPKTANPHVRRGDDGRGAPGGPPAADANTGRDANTGAPGGSNPGDIDTRITVQPRRLGKDRPTTQESPLVRNLHRRLLSTPRSRPLDRPVRNAVGIPVTPDGIRRRDDLRPNSVVVPRNLAPVTPGLPGSGRGPVAKGDRRFANTNPAVVPTPGRRGAISGTGMAHHNIGLSQIGGPRAPVAGINGTTIRPNH